MAGIDHENTGPCYLCGRLLAAMEQAQMAAIPEIKTTIVDRYYGTASIAPGTVFPTLLKNARHHLTKLRQDKAGAYYRIEAAMEGIIRKLTEFPKTLSLPEQGYFALGYYHQKDHRYQQIRENQAKQTMQSALPVE